MMTASLVVGKSEPGRGLSLALSFKDVHHQSYTPTWCANCRRFGPARTLNRPVNLSLRVPA
jgi:hypothetical protein